VPVTVPYCNDNYTIFLSGYYVRYQASFGLAVEFDGQSSVNIYIPPIYGSGQLTGLCGNNDGIAANDLTQCNGKTYSGTPADKFGDTCVVNDTDSDHPT
jgi:hypothetical protein